MGIGPHFVEKLLDKGVGIDMMIHSDGDKGGAFVPPDCFFLSRLSVVV